jgi:hypothetical protein
MKLAMTDNLKNNARHETLNITCPALNYLTPKKHQILGKANIKTRCLLITSRIEINIYQYINAYLTIR